MVNLTKKLSYLISSACLATAFAAGGSAQAASSIQLSAANTVATSLNNLLPIAGPQGYQQVVKSVVFSESALKVTCTSSVHVSRAGVSVQTFQGCTVETGVTAEDNVPQWTLLDLLTKAAATPAL